MGEHSSGGDKFLYFLAGAGIGAVLALLFAPKSGRETRELLARTAADSREFLANKVNEGKEFVGDTTRKATDDFSSFIDRSKDALLRQKEQLTAAFEAGKTAYKEGKESEQ
jgi:gas vesicle protein